MTNSEKGEVENGLSRGLEKTSWKKQHLSSDLKNGRNFNKNNYNYMRR
jgi:hypothetical protein